MREIPVQNVLLILICVLACVASRAAIGDVLKSDGKPNFVVILADDQGRNALSTRMDPDAIGSESTYYQTAPLEAIAAQGMRFSQG